MATPPVAAPTVWPGLHYADAPAAIRFLVEAFGFEEVLVVPGEAEGVVAHAELAWPPGGGVMVGSADPDGTVGSADPGGTVGSADPGGNVFARRPVGAASTYAVTDEPDALFVRATAAGAEVVRGLRDEDYGSRGFTVRDPEGNLWSFGTYRGARG